MKFAHDSWLSGHTGNHLTCEQILHRFFWPGVRRDVQKYIKTCKPCQLTTRLKAKKKVSLISLSIVEELFYRMAVNIVGPLTILRDGHRFLLIISDYATRYQEALSLRTTNTRKAAEVLEQFFIRVGVSTF
ncbi:hypothetical protein QYM36_010949 [Artemia franciscana]|uniref:Integrase zinc-binding domain-containing protein n=1 Tax=Artemia franciscana TaxID=6661 RepID=A0AA88L8I3_ARTSF|nr:hypothetical protein QYM36_010949 [Artemia franciscana]